MGIILWVFEKRVFVHRKAAKNAERVIFVQSRERRDSALRPNNYPQGSESFFLSVLSTERKNYSPFAFFAALR